MRPRSPAWVPDWLLVPQMMSSTLRRVEIVALGDRRQHRRGEALRVQVGERTLAGLADAARCAAGIDDQGFRHVVVPFECIGRWRSVVERALVPDDREGACTARRERGILTYVDPPCHFRGGRSTVGAARIFERGAHGAPTEEERWTSTGHGSWSSAERRAWRGRPPSGWPPAGRRWRSSIVPVPRAANVAEAIGGYFFECDITDFDGTTQTVAAAIEALGGLDVGGERRRRRHRQEDARQARRGARPRVVPSGRRPQPGRHVQPQPAAGRGDGEERAERRRASAA